MGSVLANIFGGRNDEDEEEAAEQQALDRWRPELVVQQQTTKKRIQQQASEESLGSAQQSDGESIASSVSRLDEGEAEEAAKKEKAEADAAAAADKVGEQQEKGSQDGSELDGDGSESEDEDEEDEANAKKEDARRKRKIIVRMEFEPLLSLHEPLNTVLEEPAELFASGKKGKKNQRLEQAAIEDANSNFRAKSKAAASWMLDIGLEDCLLTELSTSIGEEVDELRFALEQSKRFSIDDDNVVRRTLVQKLLDIMESDIETMAEIMDRLAGEAEEAGIRMAVRDSLGELKIRTANDVELIERVDPEEDLRARHEEEKLIRSKEKEERKKEQQKRRKKKAAEGEEDDEDESSDEDGGVNSKADKKVLAFRRVQVQRKIEEFLKAYTKGQNLIKINAKGRRYSRRVYIDTSKRALVIQGANGPKFFPFASMKEVDLETRTTKEGRVETLVIMAIEKGGRIVKELTLAFPDQAKANAFVNCVTLFSLALRRETK